MSAPVTLLQPDAIAAVIWTKASANGDAIARNSRRFPRLAELLSRSKRSDLERAVDLLVTALDALDGDTDLEDGEGGGNMVDERGRFLGFCPAHQDEDCEPDDPVEDDSEDRCTAGDDGCGVFVTHHGPRWGSQWDEDTGNVTIYGADQTTPSVSELVASATFSVASLS